MLSNFLFLCYVACYEPKMEKETGGERKVHNEELHKLCFSQCIVCLISQGK